MPKTQAPWPGANSLDSPEENNEGDNNNDEQYEEEGDCEMPGHDDDQHDHGVQDEPEHEVKNEDEWNEGEAEAENQHAPWRDKSDQPPRGGKRPWGVWGTRKGSNKGKKGGKDGKHGKGKQAKPFWAHSRKYGKGSGSGRGSHPIGRRDLHGGTYVEGGYEYNGQFYPLLVCKVIFPTGIQHPVISNLLNSVDTCHADIYKISTLRHRSPYIGFEVGWIDV